LFVLHSSASPRALPPFPTRRSSDLSAMAVERVLFQTNARTAMSVGQASGLALVIAARAGVPVALYSPNEVKLAVTGDGRADKARSEEHTSELQSRFDLVCRLLLEKK